jgi:Zn-dependent peptidase ImmA (M78 family)
MSLIEDARLVLSEAANRLTGDIDFPVSVRLVCQSLNVRIRRRPDLKAAVLVNAGEAPEVLLPARHKSTNSPPNAKTQNARCFASAQRDYGESWDRYLVAHELGHFVLHCARHGKPLGKSEYWLQEELCDSFARWLLLPQKAIEKWSSAKVQAFRHSPKKDFVLSALESSSELERTAHVPWAIAATRLSECLPNLGFLSVRVHDAGRLRVSASTLDRKKEIGRLIPKTSSLGTLLTCQPAPDTVSIPVAFFAGFQSRPRISTAAAQKTSVGQWRIALAFR